MNKRIKGLIDIQICTRDRPTELALLLQSLRTQTYQNFDVYIVDDCSGTPINTFHFLGCLFNRLKLEGHKVHVTRNDFCLGVSRNRQKAVDIVMEEGYGELCARLDDDVIIEQDYFEKLLKVLDVGYDFASGITSPFMQETPKRKTKFVKPIINSLYYNSEGDIILNEDACGWEYLEDLILPADQFRSCAIYKKTIHDAGVDYFNHFGKHGFREETIFGTKIILAGFKLGVHTKANARHLMTPSGGERFEGQNTMVQENEIEFRRWMKEIYKKYGNVFEQYHKRLGVELEGLDEVKYNSSNNMGDKNASKL